MKERRRLRVEISREKILTETLKLIGRHGWSAISFQMIAKSCKMSQTNILYHFPSRVRLLRAILDRVFVNNSRLVLGGMKPRYGPLERLVAHFEKNIEWAKRYPEEAQVVLIIYAEASHNLEFSKLFFDMISRAQERIQCPGPRERDLRHRYVRVRVAEDEAARRTGEFRSATG